MDTISPEEGVEAGAHLVHAAFLAFLEEFDAINRRSRERFEARDWHGCETDMTLRLDLYPQAVGRSMAVLDRLLGSRRLDEGVWSRIRDRYDELATSGPDPEIARTFFNSVTRRVFSIDGVNARIEFTERAAAPAPFAHSSLVDTYAWTGPAESAPGALAVLVRGILEDHRFDAPWVDADADSAEIGARLARRLREEGRSTSGTALGTGTDELVATPPATGATAPTAEAPSPVAPTSLTSPASPPDPVAAELRLDLVRSVFFRMKHAYLVGRATWGDLRFPFILALLHEAEGVHVDAVLLEEDDASILFSFTRAYFSVVAPDPDELVAFLRTILPRKPAAELYLSIGFYKHGKTEVYRRLARHLENSTDRFVIAEGARGMVMLVFVLPSFDLVFKVIRDHFAPPKTAGPDEVKRRYQLVFERDRVGRLVEAQSFEHLRFPRTRFSTELIEEIASEAARSTAVDDDWVTFHFLYVERKVRPLDLYLREVDGELARRAIVDYGNAIKELAAANVFPGDFLLKNFGVTRHGRVVFYDYDELCLLTDCNFREVPVPRTLEDELSAEPWYAVGPNDVFPEEFAKFLGIPASLFDTFHAHHADLLSPRFWRRLQDRHRAGEVPDVYPYARERRIVR